MPCLPDPKSFIYDICQVNPHQLAPTMGTLGIGIMSLTAFSLLASSSPEVDKNQKMELTIGSLSFYVGPSGSTCLLDPEKSGPSTNKTEIIAKSGSSVGSSSEASSPVSPAAIENLQEKLKEFDKTRGE
jgi:hypothetical protein